MLPQKLSHLLRSLRDLFAITPHNTTVTRRTRGGDLTGIKDEEPSGINRIGALASFQNKRLWDLGSFSCLSDLRQIRGERERGEEEEQERRRNRRIL
eukprot:9144668-Pyramimonas_sp.AAC.1